MESGMYYMHTLYWISFGATYRCHAFHSHISRAPFKYKQLVSIIYILIIYLILGRKHIFAYWITNLYVEHAIFDCLTRSGGGVLYQYIYITLPFDGFVQCRTYASGYTS